MGKFMRTLVTAALLFIAHGATAEQVREFGPYRVHYNAFNSTVLDPQVAQNYGITRSGHRGVLTVTVQKPPAGELGYKHAIPARVSATATDLTAKTTPVELREVREGDVVYYVGSFPFADKQVLDFSVDVQPQDAAKPFNLGFRQQFFTPQ